MEASYLNSGFNPLLEIEEYDPREQTPAQKLRLLLEQSDFFYKVGDGLKNALSFISKKISSDTFPKLSDDSMLARLKIEKLLILSKIYFNEITGKNLHADKMDKLENFISNFNDDISIPQPNKLKKWSRKFYKSFCFEIESYFENK